MSTKELFETVELPLEILHSNELKNLHKELMVNGRLRLFSLTDEEQFFTFLERNSLLENIRYDYGNHYIDFYVAAPV